MDIGSVIGKDARDAIKQSAKPHMDREKVLARRKARKQHRMELEALEWDAHRGCGWNHKVPGYKRWSVMESRGTANRATERWTDPPEWEVDPSKSYTHHKGKCLAPAPDIGPLTANEAAAIPNGMRKKRLNRHYGGRMSWNDMVQHGMMVEK